MQISYIFKEYCTYISGILYTFSDKYKAYFRTISVISRAYLRHLPGKSHASRENLMHFTVIFLAYLRKISSKAQQNLRHILSISKTYIWYFLGKSLAYHKKSPARLPQISGKSYANQRQIYGISRAYL